MIRRLLSLLREEARPEYAGRIFTSCKPLSPVERLALFHFKRSALTFYRVMPIRRSTERRTK